MHGTFKLPQSTPMAIEGRPSRASTCPRREVIRIHLPGRAVLPRVRCSTGLACVDRSASRHIGSLDENAALPMRLGRVASWLRPSQKGRPAA